jgi:hypothetical protein
MNIKKILVKIYFLVSTLFFTQILLNHNEYFITDFYLDKILNWTWLFFTLILIILLRKNKFIIYSTITFLLFLIINSALFLGIPLLNFVSYFGFSKPQQTIILNKNYFISIENVDVFGSRKFMIYKRIGILEKRIAKEPYQIILKDFISPNEPYSSTTLIQKATIGNIQKNSLEILLTINGKEKGTNFTLLP